MPNKENREQADMDKEDEKHKCRDQFATEANRSELRQGHETRVALPMHALTTRPTLRRSRPRSWHGCSPCRKQPFDSQRKGPQTNIPCTVSKDKNLNERNKYLDACVQCIILTSDEPSNCLDASVQTSCPNAANAHNVHDEMAFRHDNLHNRHPNMGFANLQEQPRRVQRMIDNQLQVVMMSGTMNREELQRTLRSIPRVVKGVCLEAPILNEEIIQNSSPARVRKDQYLKQYQTIIGSTISEAVSVMDLVSAVSSNLNTELAGKLTQSLLNIIKLNVDLRLRLTMARKDLVTQEFDTRTREALLNTESTEYLFREIPNPARRGQGYNRQ